MINHVVFIKLENPGESGLLMDDCDRLLPNIPGSADTGVVNMGSMGGQPSTRIMMSVCMSDSIRKTTQPTSIMRSMLSWSNDGNRNSNGSVSTTS